MIVKIKYMAIKMDNYQGGSGKPYNGEQLITVDNKTPISEVYEISTGIIERINKDRSDFIEERNITAIEIVKETIIKCNQE